MTRRPGADQGQCRIDDDPERRAARHVERQVGADIDPGQAHDLHDGPGGRVEPAGQVVDRPERGGLVWTDPVAPRGHGRDQERRGPGPEPDPRIG